MQSRVAVLRCFCEKGERRLSVAVNPRKSWQWRMLLYLLRAL